jgi:CelD/BcsL family acetyltransferase involved in cellulose biosynthesis
MSLDVKMITSRDEFTGMAGHWNDLVERATLRNCFHRHEWYRCWVEHIAPAARLCVVTLVSGGRLVAAAPLQVMTRRRPGIPVRVLGFLQSGITPRSGLLVEHDDLCEPLLAAFDQIKSWHVAEFKSMELEHATTRRFVECLRCRGSVVVEAGMTSPYEELPATWEAYYKSRTNKMRQRFRSAVNRVNQHDEIEVLRLDSYADLRRHFDDLLAISAASWKGAEGTDMATVRQAADFYRAYSERTDGRDAWIVYLLRLDGKPAAFMYLLRDGSHWVALRSDYDEAFAYHMPGVYLHKEVISDLAALPPPRIYDLVGWATAFKSSLAATGRPLCDLTFGARNISGRMLMQGKALLGKRSPGRYLDLDRVISGTSPPLNADGGNAPVGARQPERE